MRKSFNVSEWLEKIPAWLKAGTGMIGVIAAFIVAFRQNWYLYTTVTVVLLMAYIVGMSLYVLLKRSPSKSKKKKWNYPFEKFRGWGYAGLGFVCLSLAGLLIAQPTRTVGQYALFGTPTPVPPPKVEAADVLIAEFDSKYASQPVDVAHRLEADLESRLQDFGLGDVNVQVLAQPVASEAEAQTAANDTGSRVVIWGWYDDKGIQVKVFLSGEKEPGVELPGTNEIPLGVAGEDSTEISFVVRDVLPENVSFLSLFVIGHLEYLSDDYLAGHRAFDAAMNNMPDTVALENEAILRFFEARHLDFSGADLEDVLCGYAAAIRADPGFAEPYNNLGTVISRLYEGDRLAVQIPQGARRCLKQAGLAADLDLYPRSLYARAYALAPDLTVAHYNMLVFDWRTSGGSAYMDEEELKDIQEADPSLVGTYMILGAMLEAVPDPEGAVGMYEAGLKVHPENAPMHFNLGQLYFDYEKNPTRAEKEFREVLSLGMFEDEAYLALANAHYEQGRADEALADLEDFFALKADDTQEAETARWDAVVLKAAILFDRGGTAQAIQAMEGLIDKDEEGTGFEYFTLGMLYQYAGREEDALAMFRRAQNYSYQPSRASVGAYQTIMVECYAPSSYDIPFETWAVDEFPESGCLPKQPKARIGALFDIYRSLLTGRRIVAYRYLEDLGLACPYVYVYDSAGGRWRFETTILYRIRDVEGAQARALTRFDGRLLIREEEREVTRLNRLYVLALMKDGSTRILEPQLPALQSKDSEFVTLNQGEEVLLTFAETPPQADVAQWQVVASGYYSVIP